VRVLHYLVSLLAAKRADHTDTDPSEAYNIAPVQHLDIINTSDDLLEYTHNSLDHLRYLEVRDLVRHFDSRD
jgi:hypothetical protein